MSMRSILLTVFLGLTAIACSKVPAGHVGVKVYLLGGSKGVDHEVLGVGRYWVGFNEELYQFPVFQQTRTYTAKNTDDSPGDESFTIQTVEGMSCNMDLGVTFTIDAAKVSTLFQRYRRGVEEIQTVVIKNALRDAVNSVASSMPVEAVYGAGKTEMIANVERDVRNLLKDTGINVEKVYLLVS